MKGKNFCFLLLTATIWGMAFVAQSVGMDHVGPFTFNAVRFLIGALVLLPLIRFLGGTRGEKKDLLYGGLCCGLCLGVASNLQQIGIIYTTVGKAGFLTAFYIILVPLLGLFLRKRCGPFLWAAVGLAFVGLYLLCMKGEGSLILETGDIFMLLGAFVFALHILVIDHFAPLASGVGLSCVQFLVASLLSALPALILEHPTLEAAKAAWMPIGYAGVFSCGVAYTLQIIGQKGVNPTAASLILSLESAVSVLAGWVLLGQRLSARELSGCAVMFVAIVLAQIPGASLQPRKEPQA